MFTKFNTALLVSFLTISHIAYASEINGYVVPVDYKDQALDNNQPVQQETKKHTQSSQSLQKPSELKQQNQKKTSSAKDAFLKSSNASLSPSDQPEGYFIPLDSLIVKMLKKNPKIKTSYEKFVVARERFDETRRNILPEVRGNASYGYQFSQRGNFPKEDYPEIAYGVTLVQDLYTGGKLDAETEKAKSQMEVALSEFDEKRNQETLRFLNIFIVLYTNIESQTLSRKNIDVLQKSIDTIEQQIQAGETTLIDLKQAEARLAVEEATLEKLQAEFATLNLRYKNLIGQYAPHHLQDPSEYCQVSGTRDDLEKTILARNPIIRASRLGIDITESDLDLAKSTISPTVSLVARHNYNEGQSVFFPGESTASSAALQLSVPLFDKGMIFPRVRGAEAQKRAARYDLRGRSMDVFEQFEEFYRMYHALNKTIKAQETVIDATGKLFSATVAEHEIGFKTFYELLEVERDLVKAKSDYITSKAEHVFMGCRILALQGQLPLINKGN